MDFTPLLDCLSSRGRCLARVILLSSALCAPTVAEAQLVACDFVDPQLASELLRSSVKPTTPNREIHPWKDGGTESNCVFFAARSHLRVVLWQYSTSADAARAIRDEFSELSRAGATYTPEKALGDEAVWLSLDGVAHGYLVRKGARLLRLTTHWFDSLTSTEAKARLAPVMSGIVRKL